MDVARKPPEVARNGAEGLVEQVLVFGLTGATYTPPHCWNGQYMAPLGRFTMNCGSVYVATIGAVTGPGYQVVIGDALHRGLHPPELKFIEQCLAPFRAQIHRAVSGTFSFPGTFSLFIIEYLDEQIIIFADEFEDGGTGAWDTPLP